MQQKIHIGMLADIRRTRLDKMSFPYIIESYKNGASCYIVYSNKWCEQCGELYTNKSQSYFEIKFLKTMANTQYNIVFSAGRVSAGTGNSYGGAFDYSSLSTTSMKIREDNDTSYVRWKISGYIA